MFIIYDNICEMINTILMSFQMERLARHRGHKGASVDQRDEEGFTPLYVACQKGHKEVAQLHLDAGAIVDQPIENGSTPLMVAAQNGHCGIAR